MIRIDLASLRRFWDKGTRELRFVLDLEDPTDLDADGGEELLRQISFEIGEDLSAGGNPATTEQWLSTTEGWSAAMFEIASLDDAEEWLEQLTARLQDAVGTIRGGPRNVKRPAWASDGRAALTAYLYCTTIDLRTIPATNYGPVWGVDRALTVHLADQLLLWSHRNRATEDFTRDGNWTVQTLDLDHATTMAEAIERYSAIYVRSFRRDPHHSRSTAMQPHGQLIAQTKDNAPWPDRLTAVREILTLTPPRTDYGYICWAGGGALIPDYGEGWPHIGEHNVRGNRPLLASFVPDAFAVQLLTDAHLERAHDLTDWDRTFRSTNAIESMISICRDHAKNVKRWRDGQMALRWCAAGMVEASGQFRRVNGHLHLPALRAALEQHVAAASVGPDCNTQDVSAA